MAGGIVCEVVVGSGWYSVLVTWWWTINVNQRDQRETLARLKPFRFVLYAAAGLSRNIAQRPSETLAGTRRCPSRDGDGESVRG